jgi:transcriptional regulator with XRE-family HTH domain
VRRARRSRGLSLEALSRASGVSRAMISQIELGKSMPTIGVLLKVASALGVSPATIIDAGLRPRCVVLRGEVAKVLTSRDGGFALRALFPEDEANSVEFYELTLKGGATERPHTRPSGSTENIVVADGTLTVAIRNDRHRLHAGDAIFFGADVPHEYGNDGSDEARAYLVVSCPARELRPIDD